MRFFKADLHIHTLLSPCGDLEMSPKNIVEKAGVEKLDIIGITDHNSTRHCKLISELASQHNIFVFCGAEVTSREEAHCLAFLPDFEKLDEFQNYLDKYLSPIPNDPNKFGYQVQVDKDENIIYEEENLLISAIDQSVDEIEEMVHGLGGIFIPAHVNRQTFSIISQLGFIPPDLNYDALELSKHISKEKFIQQNAYLKNSTFIQSSDAHFISNVGDVSTQFYMEKASFDEVKMALRNEGGRFVEA